MNPFYILRREFKRCATSLCFLLALHGAQGQTLADVWSGRAEFVVDTQRPNFGASFGMHFLSTIWDNGILHAYYIRNFTVNGLGRSGVGLAKSSDGIAFQDAGLVLEIGGERSWSYDAVTQLSHATGLPDSCGWAATPIINLPGFMCYGPNATNINHGPTTASIVLALPDPVAPTTLIATVDVYDATTAAVLATRQVLGSDFQNTGVEHTFDLNYFQKGGHSIEVRTFWHGAAKLCQRSAGFRQGQLPYFDDRLASFPGVWKDGATWYMVYEGAGFSTQWPGDVALATSPDGVSWVKQPTVPILLHRAKTFERANIGTPSLWKEGSTWYLFYHGFNGADVQTAVATGPDLQTVTRVPGNPIIPTSASGWDSGTVGKRSIIKENGIYYMIFEGSTDLPFDQASWSSGLARSSDLISWEKYSGNPVLPSTGQGFGFDGPEFIRTPDDRLHVYYRNPTGQTSRATLTMKQMTDVREWRLY